MRRMVMSNFYVYAYCDPRKPSDFSSGFEPFYIGKGTNDRMFHHIQNRKGGNPIFRAKIKKILSLDLKPIIIKVSENLTEQEAFDLEVSLILQFGMFPTGCLCNLTAGGTGGKQSPAAIEKMRATKLGKPLSDVHRKSISESLKGHRRPEETKKQISKSLKGSTLSEERKRKISTSVKERFENIENLSRFTVLISGVPFATVFGGYALNDLFPGIYNSVRTGKPISRGSLKGWQAIKEPHLAAQQS